LKGGKKRKKERRDAQAGPPGPQGQQKGKREKDLGIVPLKGFPRGSAYAAGGEGGKKGEKK